MPTYILKRTGGSFSEAAYRGRIANGPERPEDFVDAASITPATPAGGQHKLRDDELAIHVPTGGTFVAAARLGWINTGRAKESDFVPVSEGAAPAPVAAAPAPAPVAAPVAAPAGGPAPTGYVGPGGVALSPTAAANYLSRGLCKPEDLVAVWPAEAVASAPVSALPISADAYTRAQLAAIAGALGLDDTGSKAALADRINAHGDAQGTADALAAL